jgi:hypothetical protein
VTSEMPSHGGNTGSNPVGDASVVAPAKINDLDPNYALPLYKSNVYFLYRSSAAFEVCTLSGDPIALRDYPRTKPPSIGMTAAVT